MSIIGKTHDGHDEPVYGINETTVAGLVEVDLTHFRTLAEIRDAIASAWRAADQARQEREALEAEQERQRLIAEAQAKAAEIISANSKTLADLNARINQASLAGDMTTFQALRQERAAIEAQADAALAEAQAVKTGKPAGTSSRKTSSAFPDSPAQARTKVWQFRKDTTVVHLGLLGKNMPDWAVFNGSADHPTLLGTIDESAWSTMGAAVQKLRLPNFQGNIGIEGKLLDPDEGLIEKLSALV